MTAPTSTGNPLAAHGVSDATFEELWRRSMDCPWIQGFVAMCEVGGRPFGDIACEVLIGLSREREHAMAMAVDLAATRATPIAVKL